MSTSIRYLVFDIESVADAPLVGKLRYPGQSLTPAEAVRRYRAELMEKFESDFIPYTFQVPVSVVVGKVAADFRLADIVVLDEPQFRPHMIVENFWRGWDKTSSPVSRISTPSRGSVASPPRQTRNRPKNWCPIRRKRRQCSSCSGFPAATRTG